jgi:hypothetical protein
MKRNLTVVRFLASLLCATLAFVIGTGCGSQKCAEAEGNGSVNLRVSVESWTTGSGLLLRGGPVDFDSVETFLITIGRITMHASSGDDSLGGVVVFDAADQPAVDNQIDLVELSQLSDLVSAVPVPADVYKQVRLEISDPHLRLVDDPPEEDRTNVHLTAHGRLFAEVDLTILPGETLDLNLVLNDLHLVEQGNGDFVLTPQLRVEIGTPD